MTPVQFVIRAHGAEEEGTADPAEPHGVCRPEQTEQADTGGGRLCGGKRMRAPRFPQDHMTGLFVYVCIILWLAGS